MTKGKNTDARGLRHATEIRDRNAGHAVDRGEAVELERVDDEMKTIRELAFLFGCARWLFLHCGFGHVSLRSTRRPLMPAKADIQ